LSLGNRFQTTLKGPFTVTGRGYWSGKLNTLSFFPAPANTGIRFHRQDLSDRRGTVALAENSQGTPLRTCLGTEPFRFQMIEHVMAALAGMQVDNAEVWCTAEEIPGMDGSSYHFAAAIEQAGIVRLSARRQILKINQTLRVGDESSWIMVEPAERPAVEYNLDYGANSPIAPAMFSAEISPETFYEEIAPARTFVTRAEADALQARGFAQHVTERDLLVFEAHGPVGNQLRFPDECARHKALDIIGDLAVIGADLLGKITAHRTGHSQNAQLAAKLRQIVIQQAARFEIDPPEQQVA
jgi:UDP-3-O-[3-hydroxymyristoyl] N-acetylglucosamine deacetylase